MSEFNIKQQNRNRFKASKEKKQAARFKQTEKLARNQHVERQSNASESSESVEVPIEKKRIPKSEKRKNREKKQNVDSNQKESVANRELDNPSPCSSKSFEWNNQNTKENNPSIFQNSQKGKPRKADVDFRKKNQFPQPFEKVKYQKNETTTPTFAPVSPVPKLQRTNFQWFNPSAIQSGSDDGISANELSKTHSTKKPNESLTNKAPKAQRKVHSQKGQNTEKPIPFTTAGLSQSEIKKVRGFFSEPSSSKSIDSDLSNKYIYNFPDFRSQPTSHKSKEESSNDESRNSKKYRKRAIKSHANRNYDLPDYADDVDEQEGERLDDLSKTVFSVSSRFLMKEQKEWLEQSETCSNPFAWNLKYLAAALNTVPFHQRHSLPENIFTPDEISHLTSEASSKIKIYDEVRREAEEDTKMNVCKQADGDILNDDFISDFLTCGDPFSIEKPKGSEKNNDSFVLSKAGSSYILNLELDEDDFVSPFSPDTIVPQKEKMKKQRTRKTSNQNKAGSSAEGKRSEFDSVKLVRGDSDVSILLRSSSEDESTKNKEPNLKNNTPAIKNTHLGKNLKEISSKPVGDKSNTTLKAGEKQQPNIDSLKSSKTVGEVVEEFQGNVSSSEDPSSFLSSPQGTEKRTRVRGYSAFNITESLSGLIAEKSSPTTASETIGGPNLESCKTSAKPSPVPNPEEIDSLGTALKKINFGSSPNFKFDFKMSSSSLPTKASDPFELNTFSQSSSKKTSDSKTRNESTSNSSNKFKTQLFTPSPPKSSTLETKHKSPKPSKLVCKFDNRIREEDIEESTSSIPTLVVTPSNKRSPAINIAKKSSGSNARSRTDGATSSAASESPSSSIVTPSPSSSSKPVIDDDEMDILLGNTPNESTASQCTSNEHLRSTKKENQQAASDSKNASTSMLNENLDDWLDSVLQS